VHCKRHKTHLLARYRKNTLSPKNISDIFDFNVSQKYWGCFFETQCISEMQNYNIHLPRPNFFHLKKPHFYFFQHLLQGLYGVHASVWTEAGLLLSNYVDASIDGGQQTRVMIEPWSTWMLLYVWHQPQKSCVTDSAWLKRFVWLDHMTIGL